MSIILSFNIDDRSKCPRRPDKICRNFRRLRRATGENPMIRKLSSGGYRIYSRKVDPKTGRRRNLGTFKSRVAAQKHEREIQYFKRR
jgi:hypothetical protein